MHMLRPPCSVLLHRGGKLATPALRGEGLFAFRDRWQRVVAAHSGNVYILRTPVEAMHLYLKGERFVNRLQIVHRTPCRKRPSSVFTLTHMEDRNHINKGMNVSCIGVLTANQCKSQRS